MLGGMMLGDMMLGKVMLRESDVGGNGCGERR